MPSVGFRLNTQLLATSWCCKAFGNRRDGGGRNVTAISVSAVDRHFPVRRKNGTPDQRQLSISTLMATNVSVRESLATPDSLRYGPTFFLPISPAPYCARTEYFGASEGTIRRTDSSNSTCLSRKCFALKEIGGSIAISESSSAR